VALGCSFSTIGVPNLHASEHCTLLSISPQPTCAGAVHTLFQPVSRKGYLEAAPEADK
jgi:hypothetical protein